MSNERIDLTQFEESIETANAYMESWFKGTVTPMNGKEWRDIKDLGLHVDWSHNEVFGPLVEEFPDLIAELKRCYEREDELIEALKIIRDDLDDALETEGYSTLAHENSNRTLHKIRNFANDASQ